MEAWQKVRLGQLGWIGGLAVLLLLGLFWPSKYLSGPPNRNFAGADQCKQCHGEGEKGNPYSHWSKSPHARAFTILASQKAKEVAKARKIEDPQKSADCLKCHVTGGGSLEGEKAGRLDTALGIQCETCHGPGSDHVKARREAGGKGHPAKGEIEGTPLPSLCRTCHNSNSPTYKPLCLKRGMKAVTHPPVKANPEPKPEVSCDCPKCQALMKK